MPESAQFYCSPSHQEEPPSQSFQKDRGVRRRQFRILRTSLVVAIFLFVYGKCCHQMWREGGRGSGIGQLEMPLVVLELRKRESNNSICEELKSASMTQFRTVTEQADGLTCVILPWIIFSEQTGSTAEVLSSWKNKRREELLSS